MYVPGVTCQSKFIFPDGDKAMLLFPFFFFPAFLGISCPLNAIPGGKAMTSFPFFFFPAFLGLSCPLIGIPGGKAITSFPFFFLTLING